MNNRHITLSLCLAFLVVHIIAHDIAGHDSGKFESRIDAFHEILDKMQVGDSHVLPVDKLQKFITELFQQFHCVNGEPVTSSQASKQCSQTLCLNASHLISFVGGNASQGISENEFNNVSLVLLYYMTHIKHMCNKQIDLSGLTMKEVTDSLLFSAKVDHHHMHDRQISNLLNTFKDSLSHHGHEHKDEHGSHTEDNAQGHHDENHDHDHENENHVVKQKCLNAEAVFYYLDVEHSVDNDQIGPLASLIVYLIYDGYEVEEKCRLLPQKGEFIDYLFSVFAAKRPNMSADGLLNLMTKLGINPDSHSHDEHSHDEHSHDEHSHKEAEVHSHRKRSVSELHTDKSGDLAILNRLKRQAASHAGVRQCYTAEQIMALYDAQDGIGQEVFQQICPTLLSQKLFADCSITDTPASSHATMAEKYGYSTIATAVICLCSIFGVIFIPFVSKNVYDALMSSFVGLAVGTLFSDAVLHLVPMALGVHNHGHEHGESHGHEHGPGIIVVEEYVLYGLAIMAGLYFFYILETVMSRFGNHSHSHDINESDMMMFPNDQSPKSDTYEAERETPKERCGSKYTVNGDSLHMLTEQRPSSWACGLTPVALMIILGDGIHNFADGLAIGASFTSGISTGIATSIAVFCHELPHELGDFAVLLQSGLGFKKAVFLNLASALTAFAGLYVSLSVTTGEEAQRWIFAVTSGMFLYIALVDLLPQLVKSSGLFHFVLNNIGIMVGFAIMLVIAIFEEHIKV